MRLLALLILLGVQGCGKKEPRPVETPSDLGKIYLNKKVQQCIEDKGSYGYSKYHSMKQGETLYRLSKKYNVSVGELIEVNKIADHTDIKIGEIILIPGEQNSEFQWPLNGLITSKYGRRGRKLHSGIDISADKGTHIKAIADGLVIESSKRLKGFSKYGRVVIIDHGLGITSLYAHNKKNLVKAGSCVKKGQVVAEVGSSGNATGNHLHMEIRKHGRPVNPLIYLEP